MARKKKVINRDSPFLRRLIGLSSKDSRSLSDLESEFGASRQTIAKWQIADALPDIDQLENIADYYKVSTDNLLGRCDTMSPDVNLREAMEYTGLSESAIERIHSGFVKPKHFQLNLSGEGKEEKLFMASQLLQSSEFGNVLDHLAVLYELSFFKGIIVRLAKRYCIFEPSASDNGNYFSSAKEREFIVAAIRDAHQKGRLFQEEGIIERVTKMNDVELVNILKSEVIDIQSKMDLRQYLVTKELNRYTERLLQMADSNVRTGMRN